MKITSFDLQDAEDHGLEESVILAYFKYVSAWEYKEGNNWELHKEDLIYENIKIAQRSYK